jgi:hypothetical protein
MATRLYFLLSFLPTLPPLGESPPITIEEVLRIIKDERVEEARILADAFDFEAQLMKAAYLRLLGYSASDTADSFSFDRTVPPFIDEIFLKDPRVVGEDAWFTELWSEHLDFLEEVGKLVGSPLLWRYAKWERSLRDQLAILRRPPEEEAQAPTVSGDKWDHRPLLADWRAAPDPMAGERLLDKARLKFIDEKSQRYSFRIDELTAYFLKLGLLARHARLQREEGLRTLEEVTAL